MKKSIRVGSWFFIVCVTCSGAYAAAPVVEAQAQIPAAVEAQQATPINAKPVARYVAPNKPANILDISNLPRVRWEDASSQSRQQTRVALADEQPSARDSPTLDMSDQRRLEGLSKQMDRVGSADVSEKVQILEQTVAQLRGQLLDQGRTINSLQSKQSTFYQSINQQIKQLQNQINNASASDSAPTAASGLSQATATPIKTTHAVRRAQTGQQMYQAAYNAMLAKRYSVSQKGFKGYLKAHASGSYAANSNYWLGEIALLKKQYKLAQSYFSRVVKLYPHSSKRLDAQYKLAVTHFKLGRVAMAREELQSIEKRYHGKIVARLAKLQLEQMAVMPQKIG